MKTILSFLFAIGLCLPALDAQKIGIIDKASILGMMIKINNVDEYLEKYETLLSDSLDIKIDQFRKKVIHFEKGDYFDRKVYQEVVEQLKAEQNELQLEAQAIEEKVMEQRNIRMQPIIAKMNQAINLVKKEEAYDEIIDLELLGAMYYFEKQYEITEKVIKLLGLKD